MSTKGYQLRRHSTHGLAIPREPASKAKAKGMAKKAVATLQRAFTRQHEFDERSAPSSLVVAPSMDDAEVAHENRKSPRSQILYLRNVANENALGANWWINGNGQTELHLDSGEVFLIQEAGVTRLK